MTYQASRNSKTNVTYTTGWKNVEKIVQNFFTKCLACKIKPANFQQFWKKLLCKRHSCNKIDTVHHKKLFLCLCQGFSTFLSILKCFSKARYEHFITRSQYPTKKYENKRRTAETGYEHINTIRRCRD